MKAIYIKAKNKTEKCQLIETAHMFSSNNLLSRPSIELNTLLKPLIKKVHNLKIPLHHSIMSRSVYILVQSKWVTNSIS